MCRMVIILVLMGLCVHTASALPGSGTQQDPYRIQSLADFDEFAADPNYWSGFTRLQTDVNLAGRTYITAVIAPDVNNSNYDFDGTAFTGVFDGNDHKLTNLTINGGANDYLGLFGCIYQGEVRNLGFVCVCVSGDYDVGGLVGANGNYPHPGGKISNCYSTGDVSGTGWDIGGLVGWNFFANISNCYSTGDVNGTMYYVGGLVGRNLGGSVSNCYSTGDVSCTIYDVGGLVGYNNGTISNCYSSGSVRGDETVGGLVGGNLGTVSNCYSTGDVNGDYNVGGLVGYNCGRLSNCYSTGDVNGVGGVGGLVGGDFGHGNISNCYSTGSVSGDQEVGGLAGWSAYGQVRQCYSTGSVSGMDCIGGLVGSIRASGISNCYSIGNVNGRGSVGGLLGQNGMWSPSGIEPGYIFNSYSTGAVDGVSNVGGLIGYHFVGYIEGSFWDIETSGEPNMCGFQNEGWATGCDPNCGKTTAQMQTKSIFTDAGWDFIESWGIGEHQTYPFLRTEPAGDLNYDKKVDLFDLAILASHWLEGI